MNGQKIVGKKTIILFILALVVLSSSIFYYRYWENENKEVVINTEDEKAEVCPRIVTAVTDGTFREIKNNLLYIAPREEKGLKSVPLTDGTMFFDFYLSPSGEPTGQKEINQNDLKPEDHLSVIISYKESAPDKFTAQTVRRMITLTDSE